MVAEVEKRATYCIQVLSTLYIKLNAAIAIIESNSQSPYEWLSQKSKENEMSPISIFCDQNEKKILNYTS